MSWGERSCKHAYKCPNPECSMTTCRVCCAWYEWDGETEPDSHHYWEFRKRNVDMTLVSSSGHEVEICHFCGTRK